MKNKIGRLFMVLGSLLILSSFALLIYNREDAKRAGENADAALVKVREAASETNIKAGSPYPAGRPVRIPGSEPKILPSKEIDGYGYIGYISVPALGLELPVMDRWDYKRLRIAPCRQSGDTADGLIIAAHNYMKHFGTLHSLTAGETVYFTDMDGERTYYMVVSVDKVRPNALESLKAGEWNMVLYTCTYDSRRRVMAICKKLTPSPRQAPRKQKPPSE